jgi:hypothetical protein
MNGSAKVTAMVDEGVCSRTSQDEEYTTFESSHKERHVRFLSWTKLKSRGIVLAVRHSQGCEKCRNISPPLYGIWEWRVIYSTPRVGCSIHSLRIVLSTLTMPRASMFTRSESLFEEIYYIRFSKFTW